MSNKVPRKRTRACANFTKALSTTVLAVTDAAQRQRGINLETTFPEGRMQVVIGQITVSVSQPKLKNRKS